MFYTKHTDSWRSPFVVEWSNLDGLDAASTRADDETCVDWADFDEAATADEIPAACGSVNDEFADDEEAVHITPPSGLPTGSIPRRVLGSLGQG